MSSQKIKLTPTQQDLLLKATELIGRKERWIKHYAFRPSHGEPNGSYCAVGAVFKAKKEHTVMELLTDSDCCEVINALCSAAPNGSIVIYNDSPSTSHNDIKAVFCKAVRDYVDKDDPTGD